MSTQLAHLFSIGLATDDLVLELFLTGGALEKPLPPYMSIS